MRVTLILLCLIAFQLQAEDVYSQKMKISLDMKNASIEKVLQTIEEKSDYYFLYNNRLINADRKVSINVKDVPVSEILDKIFESTDVQYLLEGNQIILSPKEKIAEKISKDEAIEQQPQQKEIRGKVSDVSGQMLPGVTVLVKGTSIGTTTDANGNFVLRIPSDAHILQFSFIGMKTQEIPIGEKTTFNVILEEEATALQEVVAVGYGVVKKRDLTGSVGTIDASEITAASVPSATEAMQGKIAGVNIVRNVAKPGGSFSISVRGLSSINNNTGPLYIIDGIPTTSDLNDLNPSDIEKIDVLKDASATAIYGSRGANGVIIVSTKKGKEGQFRMQYEGYYGYRVASNLPDMMNGPEYVQWRTDLYTNLGRSTARTNSDFFTSTEWKIIDSGNYTDWIDLVLRKGVQTSNTLTASGGDDKGTFAISIGQLKEQGTVPGQDFNRYNMHLNVNHKFLSKWETGGNMYFTYSIQNEGSYETLRSAYRLPPVAYPYDENGNLNYYVYRSDNVSNPLLEYSKDGEKRENLRYRAFGNIYLQVEPIKGLSLRSQLSPQMIYRRNGLYQGVNCKNTNGKIESTNASDYQQRYWGYVLDNQVNYAKEIGKHNINFNFVQSIQFEQWEASNQAAKNFPFNSEWYNLDATTLSNVTESSTDYTQRSLASFLGRFQYSWNSKYLFTMSGRYDGSSRLAEGNKWAFFPSAALAWRVSEEGFMKKFSNLSNLKLRLSYGVTGNDAVAIYATQAGVTQKYYDFGGTVSTSYYKNGLANQNLTWEKTYEINLGVDYGFFNNRINGSVDLYQRDAKDLIMQRNLPSTSGWSTVWDNIGWVRNRGLELALNTVNIETKNFSWATNIIFDTNKNKIVELYGAKKDDVGNKWFIGKPVRVNYDYVFDGIWQKDQATEAAKYGQTPGQVKVKDLDNNGVIDAKDKKVIGQQTPKWTGSITNTFTYKNWDLSFNVYTRQGAQLQSTFLSSFMSLEGNYKNLNVSYWTSDNPSNKYPQPGNKGKYFDAMRYCDVSFVRVENITLGYTIPKKILDKVKIKNLRCYFTTNNPFTFTSYPGYDPEWADQNTWGESTSYTTYLLGLKLEF